MREDFSDLNNDDRIRAENQVLKMKLMLEKGARFHGQPCPLPPAVENEFLKHVIAFEKQLEEHKLVKVFEKLGSPRHFLPVDELRSDQLDQAWKELDWFMKKKGISLDVFSPNIPPKELYRFVTEELFLEDIEDFNLPGMTYCFIYDEFHPDPVYENSRAALDTLAYILRQNLIEHLPHLRRDKLRLNDRFPLNAKEFSWFVNQFKQAYENIDEPELEQSACAVNEKHSVVSGSYKLKVSLQTEYIQLQGQWSIEFELDEELGFWYGFNVQIEGINF